MGTLDARHCGYALGALWPAGLLLVLVKVEFSQVSTVFFAVAAALYAGVGAVLIRRLYRAGQAPAATLAAAGIGLFAVVGFAGEPTAVRPSAMLLNTAILFVVAVALLLGMVGLSVRFRTSPRMSTVVPALVLLLLGTGGFLLNLLARVAIVLVGADGQQLAVEHTHWQAANYLRGLPGPADFVGYTLVWLDLVQLAYLVTGYLAAAALAWLTVRSRRAATILVTAGLGLASMLTIGAVAAIALPHSADAVPATIAFVTSIPFMATLIPFALAAVLLTETVDSDRTHPSGVK
ncbi:hypothetical protein [Nocardia lasii]|uniref:Uncharacterized protein n=1 Tax=Nocardia lasii TaxID=1616107 RepID=A0ABW1JPH5_9NOCA